MRSTRRFATQAAFALARPTKLTPELQAAIIADVEGGASPEVAAQAAGIDRATFYRWMARGAEDEQAYVGFRDGLLKAGAMAEVAAVKYARSGESGWQGSAWWLERRHPDRYALDRITKRLMREKLRAEIAALKARPEADDGNYELVTEVTHQGEAPVAISTDAEAD